jgi:TorA maturation chaperone TorD
LEDEKVRRTRARDEQWWDIILSMSNADLLAHIHRFESTGRNLAFSVHPSSSSSSSSFSTTNTITNTHTLLFQGHRSTLNPPYLTAYTELLARFVTIAHHLSIHELEEEINDHHWLKTHFPPQKPIDAFSTMLDLLSYLVSPPLTSSSRRVLVDHISPLHGLDSRDLDEEILGAAQRSRKLRESVDPFFELRRYVDEQFVREMEDMVRFVERFEGVGGYLPTTGERLLGLLRGEEERRRGRGEKGKSGVLEGEVSCGEDEVEGGSLVMSSVEEMGEVEREEVRNRVTAWLDDLLEVEN